MTTNINTNEFIEFYRVGAEGSDLPMFKDEKEKKASIEKTPEAKSEAIRSIFEEVAKSKYNSHFDTSWGTSDARKIRSSFYSELSKTTNLEVKEIQKKIQEYVKYHPAKVLNMAREIADKTGWNLENIKQSELIDLINQTSINILSSLIGDEPTMKNRHLANLIIAQISAEIFKINIDFHDVLLFYDPFFHSATAWEQVHIKATSSNDAPQLNLVQGFAILSHMFSKEENMYYHIEPQKLIPNTPKS